MITLISALCFILIILFVGDTANLLLFRNSFIFPRALRFSLAYGFGTGVVGLLVFYVSYLGFSFNLLTILFLTVLFTPFFLLRIYRRDKGCASPVIQKNGILEYLLLFVIVVSLVIVFFKALCLPMHLADDRGQWGLQAKKIYQAGSIYVEDFSNTEMVQLHVGYPLLIPLIESSFYGLFGKIDDTLVKLPFPFFFLCLLLFFYSSQRNYASHRHALFFTAMLAVLPPFIQDVNGSPSSGYADVPFTFYYVVSGLSIFNWLANNRKRDLLLGIPFVCFAMFTKQEGMIVWAGIIVAVVLFLLVDKTSSRTQRIKWFSLFIVFPLVLLVPWFHYKSTLILSGWEKDWTLLNFTPQYITSHLYRAPIILKAMRNNLLTPQFWNYTWIIFGLTAILFFRKTIKFPNLFLLVIVAINILAVFSAVLLYPWPWWGNFYRDMYRVLMMNVPFILFFVSVLLAKENIDT